MGEEVKRKPRIGFISSDPGSKTGFGGSLRVLMKYLYENYSDKYDFYVLAQGSGPSPETKDRWPWHTTCALECQIDQARWHKGDGDSQAYQRFLAYGNGVVQQWVTSNEISLIFAKEDCWAFDQNVYLKSNWFKKVKDNFVLWSTADSLPILEQFKDYAEQSEFWSWTSFAEKELKEENPEKFASVKTVPGAIDPIAWKPISPNEKLELRAKFGISPKTKLLIHLSRNQLRKFFWASLESMAIFKKRNPEHDCKLLIHCSWSEPAGWDLPRFIKEFGIDNNDVLTTYFCRVCTKWEVKPFVGENQPCKCCGQKDSMITAGVNSTVTDSDLSKIYGMCDGAISAFSSGGLEYGSVNPLLCEIPLACTDYACGKDFTCHDFVHSITGSYYREVHTNFIKHTPNINDLVKFWKKICELTPDKKEKIVKPARAWALEYFGVERIAKIVVDRIENSKIIDWSDYHGEGGRLEQYQPNAVIDLNLEGNELIKSLYQSILGMDLEPSDPGFQNWCQQLSQGAAKDQIISYFRNVALQEIQKLSGPSSIEDLFDKSDKEQNLKRVLLVCPESLGDTIILSSLFPSIRARYPRDKWKFYYATNTQYFEAVEGNPYIDKIIPYAQIMENLIYMEGGGEHKGFVDICYLPTIGSQRNLNYLHRGIDSIDLELK